MKITGLKAVIKGKINVVKRISEMGGDIIVWLKEQTNSLKHKKKTNVLGHYLQEKMHH